MSSKIQDILSARKDEIYSEPEAHDMIKQAILSCLPAMQPTYEFKEWKNGYNTCLKEVKQNLSKLFEEE